MAIAEKLNVIRQAITNIKNALIAKGCTVSGDITTFADVVETITTSSDVVIESKEVTPSTVQQTITAPENVGGYNPIIVKPVTAAIDNNIQPENIKSGTIILNTAGSLVPVNNTTLNITPSTTDQNFNPSSPYTGYSNVTVNAVTADIDLNIQPQNIKKDIVILGTQGTYEGNEDSAFLDIKLESNGTMGNNTFAVSNLTNLWKAFDKDETTYYSNNNDFTFTFYSPIGIILTGLSVKSSGSIAIQEEGNLIIKGSNDNFSWTTLQYIGSLETDNGNGSITIYSYEDDPFYSFKYFKFENFYTTRSNIKEIKLSGTFDDNNKINTNALLKAKSMFGNFNYIVKTDGTIDYFGTTNDRLAVNETQILTETYQQCYLENTNIACVSLANITQVGTTDGEAGDYECILSSTFDGAENLRYIDISNLRTIKGYGQFITAFSNTCIEKISFDSLNRIEGRYIQETGYTGDSNAFVSAFTACRNLKHIYFPSLTSTSFVGCGDSQGSNGGCFHGLLNGTNGCTVHFPTNLQSVMGSWTDVTNKFGGTNATILFDLPSTATSLGCVLYNTPILMANNTIKEAQDIKVGNLIQTYDENNNIFESNKVLAISNNQKDDIINIKFNDDSFIEITSGHPILTEKGWASYDNEKTIKENLYNGAELYQLEIGDKCLTVDGNYIEIVNITSKNIGKVNVYDFTIENNHTFIGNNIVLHNMVTSGTGA